MYRYVGTDMYIKLCLRIALFPEQLCLSGSRVGAVPGATRFRSLRLFTIATNEFVKTDPLIRATKKRTSEGAAIRRLRTKAGISQEHLARRVGVTAHTIWRLENDPTANPRLETLRAIARALGVGLSHLVGD